MGEFFSSSTAISRQATPATNWELMNTQTRNLLDTLSRIGRVLWKLYGLAWFAVIIPVIFYMGIALCRAMGTLYVVTFGPIGGAILLIAASLGLVAGSFL